MLRERDIEKELKEAVEASGGLCYKWVSPGNNGVPDRIVILPGGEICFVELKTATGQVSPIQRAQLRKLAKMLPMQVFVLRGIPGVVWFLEKHRMKDAAERLEAKYPEEKGGFFSYAL